jgi:hypothetical protein
VNSPSQAGSAYPNRFRAGQSGNPRGRPRGSRNTRPTVRAITLAVARDEKATIEASLKRALRSPRHTLHLLELFARLNEEIGGGSDHSAPSLETRIPCDQLGP